MGTNSYSESFSLDFSPVSSFCPPIFTIYVWSTDLYGIRILDDAKVWADIESLDLASSREAAGRCKTTRWFFLFPHGWSRAANEPDFSFFTFLIPGNSRHKSAVLAVTQKAGTGKLGSFTQWL